MNKAIKILLVEDEHMLAEILRDTLTTRNFIVHLAYDGVIALEMLKNEQYDVIVSDIMMPSLDGFSLTKELRSKGCTTPILFLSARSATEDVVKGFKIWGNDFLKKPFAMDELIVRLQALAGRISDENMKMIYRVGNFSFDPYRKMLILEGNETVLAARESEVLLRLCQNMGKTVEASGLLKELWGDDNYFNLRSLNVYISRLRHRLEADGSIEIVSVRSVGYQLRCLNS